MPPFLDLVSFSMYSKGDFKRPLAHMADSAEPAAYFKSRPGICGALTGSALKVTEESMESVTKGAQSPRSRRARTCNPLPFTLT